MEISTKEQRKMLNAAWDKAAGRFFGRYFDKSARQRARYRDVSKIIREAEEREKKPCRKIWTEKGWA